MQCKELTRAQRTHMAQLLAEMVATEQVAQRFLAFLAQEHGVTIGIDGWLFDVENLRFIQACPVGDMRIYGDAIDNP